MNESEVPVLDSVPDAPRRRRLLVRGIVQGVGFRPFVHGTAVRLGLDGFVGNDSSGVFLEIEGPPPALDAFERALTNQAPPLARVFEVRRQEMPARGEPGFTIVSSHDQTGARTLVSPDICVCEDCLSELHNPADRRYGYPFINCTNCGPRFTIIEDIPYDRPRTTMRDFPLCPACAAEYAGVANRRYHAQPIACPECGPRAWLQWPNGRRQEGPASAVLAAARQALAAGSVLAVKGLGGFHLACEAGNEGAVAALRRRKGRDGKPFAVMVRDLAAARRLADPGPAACARLTSPERPIVILRRREDGLAPSVAPSSDSLGLMLPYTPLHYLLVDQEPLVMTSGNRSGAPIAIDNHSALTALAGVADVFLLHDRRIHVPCDDSVIRVFQGADLPIRRSRGYAPYPVRLPFVALPVLAVGGELKSTTCVAVGDEAVLSQHIGDMENVETVAAFTRIAAHLSRLFRVRPERIACDQHPGYLSRRWAVDEARRLNLPLVQVQHHHAHIAAVMAEHLVPPGQTVIGFSFDGTGYGTDGAIWGGELLLAGYGEFRRAAHLRYIPLPGGDSAIRHPYRCALAHLWAANIAWDDDLAPVMAARSWELRVLERQMRGGVRVVPCSSMGRLFDAVAALIGLTQSVTYEAQAAMEMEAQLPDADQMADADPLVRAAGYAFSLPWAEEEMSTISIDPAPVLRALVADLRRGTPVAVMAERFHGSVAAMVLALSLRMRDKEGLDTVALSGGVWQNTRLLAMVKAACEARGFRVLCHHLVPPNDGGLALGQAAIASQCVPRAPDPMTEIRFGSTPW